MSLSIASATTFRLQDAPTYAVLAVACCCEKHFSNLKSGYVTIRIENAIAAAVDDALGYQYSMYGTAQWFVARQ